jgi:hypothetical protein
MLRRRVEREAKAKPYSDIAIDPVSKCDQEKLALYEQSEAARRAMAGSRQRTRQAQTSFVQMR